VCVCVCITKLFCLFLSFHDFSLLSSSGSPLPDFRGLDFFFFLAWCTNNGGCGSQELEELGFAYLHAV
jgi:hypothetical protein